MGKAGLRWNNLQPRSVTSLPKCWLSINAIRGSRYRQDTIEAKDYGHKVFWLWGAESAPMPYGSVTNTEYVRALASALDTDLYTLPAARQPDLVGGHNESIVDWYNRDGVGASLPLVKAIDTALWAVCRKYGVKYAITSTLCHNWSWAGGNNGWSWLQEHLYANDAAVQGDVIDIHAYTNVEDRPASLRPLIASWVNDSGFKKPFFIGEFGTAIGDDIPVAKEIEAVTSFPQVMAACYFCLQDFGDATKRYGLLRQDGSAKPAYQEFIDYVAQEAPEETMPDAKLHLTLVPSVQNNRPYPKPGDGDYAENEGDFATWFCGSRLLPLAKAKGLEAHVDQGVYQPGDDLAPLYVQRARIISRAKANPQTKYLVVSIHTEGTKHEPNLFGGRYLGPASKQLLGAIDDQLAKVHPTGAWRFEYDSPSYILLDGYPSNCVLAIVELAGDSTVGKVKFLSSAAEALANAVMIGISNYIGAPVPVPTPTPPPIDNQWTKRIEELTARVTALEQDKENLQAEIDENLGIIKNVIGMVDKTKAELTKAL